MKKVYLVWQPHETGTGKHIRRVSSTGKFLGFEKQELSAVEWLKKNGDPTYPYEFDSRTTPFEIVQE